MKGRVRFALCLFSAALITLFLYILIHESGHMIVMLSAGATITEFSIFGAHVSRKTAGSDPLVSIWVLLIILFLLVLTIFLSGLNKKEDYDERQRLERGKAYGLGFFTIMGSVFLAIAIDLLELLPVQGYVLCAASIFPGLMAFLAYSIWHEAYFSLKDKTGALLGMFGIIGAINLIIAVASICDGSMIVNGRLGLNALNAACAVMFIEIFVVVLMKKISTAKETDEEDED